MKVRRSPTDFLVDELLRDDVRDALSPTPRRDWCSVYRLTKTSLTTDDAARRLARALDIPRPHVAHAGLKDKHAVTTQHFTARTHGAAPPRLTGPAWHADLLGYAREEAAAAWIRRNRFTLILRCLSPDDAARLDANAAFLTASPARLLLINYFGEQRFGSARHAQGFAAPHLCRADFETALRLLIATPARKDAGERRSRTRTLAEHWGNWQRALAQLSPHPERRAVEALARGASFRDAFAALPSSLQQMCVEAYQSHIWNRVAAQLALTRAPAPLLTDPSATLPSLPFPPPASLNPAWRTLELPMPSPKLRPGPPWGEPLVRALADDALSLDQLRIPGLHRPAFGEAWRPFTFFADDFSLSAPEPDDTEPDRLRRTLRFELPRGSYATIVARALGAPISAAR